MNEVVNGKGEVTMITSNKKEIKVKYIIIKIGDKIYSTKFGNSASDKGCYASIQDTNTLGIGMEKSWMIRNIPLEETNKHQSIEKINAEIDLYFEEEKTE